MERLLYAVALIAGCYVLSHCGVIDLHSHLVALMDELRSRGLTS